MTKDISTYERNIDEELRRMWDAAHTVVDTTKTKIRKIEAMVQEHDSFINGLKASMKRGLGGILKSLSE